MTVLDMRDLFEMIRLINDESREDDDIDGPLCCIVELRPPSTAPG